MDSQLTDNVKFNYYITWLPVVTGLIILMGLVQQVVYYWMFRLNIFEFITVSDALVACLPLAILSGICTIFAYYETRNLKINTANDLRISNEEMGSEAAIEELEQESIDQQQRKLRSTNVRFTSMALLFCILILVGFNVSGISNWFNSALFYIVIIVLMLLTFLFTQWIEHYPVVKSKFLTRAIKYFVVLNLFLLYRNLTAAIDLKNGDARRTVKILQLKNNTVLSLDSALVYVGRFENYTFLYNLTNHEKQVIDNSEIMAFTYR